MNSVSFIRLTRDRYYFGSFKTSPLNPYTTEGVAVYDNMLHETLTKILRECDLTKSQIKELLRSTDSANEDSIFKLIQKQKPALCMHCEHRPVEGLNLSLLWMTLLCHYKNSLELLVRSGADVNQTFGIVRIGLNERSTVLHAMVRLYPLSEHERLIQLVMDHGADLGAQDSVGETVIHLAVRQDRVQVARMFLDNGADVNVENFAGNTPFSLIAKKNLNNPMVQLIIKALALRKFNQPMIEIKDESLMKVYPELWEYYQDCIEHVSRAKFIRFDKDHTFFQLLTECPCSIAGWMRIREIRVFESNFRLQNLNVFSMYEKDLLRAFQRARNYYDSIVEMEDTFNKLFRYFLHYKLLRKGVRYLHKCYCKLGVTHHELAPFLHLAILDNYEVQTEMLLQEGADVNSVDDNHNGATPLLLAVQRSSADVASRVVTLLLKHGADIFAKDRIGMNVLHHLARSIVERADMARIFIEKGVSVNDRTNMYQYQPIHVAALNGRNEYVKLFLDHGADVHSRAIRDDDDTFPLYLAAECNNPKVIETLLKRGATIDMRTKNGRTALHIACKVRKIENVKVLLSAGADVLVEDNEYKTPFSLITRTAMRKSEPIVKIMIKALVLKKLCQPSIELKDEMIMRKIRQLQPWNYYQDCIAQITKMKHEQPKQSAKRGKIGKDRIEQRLYYHGQTATCSNMYKLT